MSDKLLRLTFAIASFVLVFTAIMNSINHNPMVVVPVTVILTGFIYRLINGPK